MRERERERERDLIYQRTPFFIQTSENGQTLGSVYYIDISKNPIFSPDL